MRRMLGLFSMSFSDDLLKQIPDPRSTKNRRWASCLPFLRAIAVGLACGCKGFREVERLTERLSKPARKLVGINKRVPDTTLSDFVKKLDVNAIHKLLQIVAYDAWRRKALPKIYGMPFHVVSLDGKYPFFKVEHNDYEYGQDRHDKETGEYLGSLLRTTTATLITAPGRPLLGATPIPRETNEMGWFQKSFGDLVRVFGKQFEMVMYDAGAACEANAKAVVDAGKHYFFQLADARHDIYKTLEYELADAEIAHESVERISSGKNMVRRLYRVPNVSTSADGLVWPSAKTLFKVESWTTENGQRVGKTETRYFVTSMEGSQLRSEQWLRLVVMRWGVETCHQILDVAFQEDKRPWFTKDMQGALAIALLRRLVFTVMTLFRSRTQRSEEKRSAPWRELFEDMMDAMKMATEAQVAGLRQRTYQVPPALA